MEYLSHNLRYVDFLINNRILTGLIIPVTYQFTQHVNYKQINVIRK